MDVTTVSVSAAPQLENQVDTLVLQPSSSLDASGARAFQMMLEEALYQVSKVVIVDLIWVESVAPEGLAALRAGIGLASSLGKELLFWSADASSYAALEVERQHQRSRYLCDRTSFCTPELEAFLKQERTLPSTVKAKGKTKGAVPSGKPFIKPAAPKLELLPAAPYTQTAWSASQLAG